MGSSQPVTLDLCPPKKEPEPLKGHVMNTPPEAESLCATGVENMCIYMNIHMQMFNPFVYTFYVYTYIYIYVYVCVCIHTHTYIYIYIHIHIYTCMCTVYTLV